MIFESGSVVSACRLVQRCPLDDLRQGKSQSPAHFLSKIEWENFRIETLNLATHTSKTPVRTREPAYIPLTRKTFPFQTDAEVFAHIFPNHPL
jgi:hypothetical protein